MSSEPGKKLFAKLRGKRGKCIKVLMDVQGIEGLDFYREPNLDNAIPLDSGRLTEVDEWYRVVLDDELTREAMIGPYLEKANSTGDMPDITSENYTNIETFYFYKDGKLFFTKITPACYLADKTFIFKFGSHPEIERRQGGLEIPHRIDAYYDGDINLYFKDYSTVRGIFSGLEDFFHEASKDEQVEFLNNEMFNVQQGVVLGVRPARKIGMLLANPPFNLHDIKVHDQLREYAKKYVNSGIKMENGKFVIASSKDADLVLNLIGERFYITPLTNEKREAHEVSKIK